MSWNKDLILCFSKGDIFEGGNNVTVSTAGERSADLISSVQPSSPIFVAVEVVTVCWSSSSELIVRDGWDRGLPLVPSRLVSLFWLLPPHHHLQFLCLLFCLVRLVVCSKLAEMSRGLFCFLNKGVRGFRSTQMWIHSLPALTFTALCGPNSLCLLSKDWLGKRPSCAAAPKSQHKVNSSSALINHHFLCKCSFHYDRSGNRTLVKWPQIICDVVKSNTIFLKIALKSKFLKIAKWLAKVWKSTWKCACYVHPPPPPVIWYRFNAWKCLKREGVLLSTDYYVMNLMQKCKPATWWQNNEVSNLWLAINNSGF